MNSKTISLSELLHGVEKSYDKGKKLLRESESNVAALRFRDGEKGLEETITKMKADAAAANADNLKAKTDAMKTIGSNLNRLRQAMARRREYDQTTVKSVTNLAKILMDAGLLYDLSKLETKRILGAVNNVVGRQDVSKYVMMQKIKMYQPCFYMHREIKIVLFFVPLHSKEKINDDRRHFSKSIPGNGILSGSIKKGCGQRNRYSGRQRQ